MAFIPRAPAGASYSEPKSGFHTAGHDRTHSWLAPTGPSVGVPRPSPQSMAPTGPTVGVSPSGPHSAGPGRSSTHGPWLGFLFGGTSVSTPRPNFHSADSGQALSRRVTSRLSKGRPHRHLSRLFPAGLSHSRFQSLVPQLVYPTGLSYGEPRPSPQPASPDRVFTRRALAVFYKAGPG